MTDAERIHELEDQLAEIKGDLAEAEEEVTDLQHQLKAVPDPMTLLVELECRCCHRRFTSLPDVRYCSRDCEMGWTRAERFGDYYLRMHPARCVPGQRHTLTNTDPVLT